MSLDLGITLTLIVVEVVGLLWCLHMLRQPPDPSKPRLLPYNLILVFFMVALLATLAHLVSLVTGEQVQPRRRRGM